MEEDFDTDPIKLMKERIDKLLALSARKSIALTSDPEYIAQEQEAQKIIDLVLTEDTKYGYPPFTRQTVIFNLPSLIPELDLTDCAAMIFNQIEIGLQ